jgi:hypothetical protein
MCKVYNVGLRYIKYSTTLLIFKQYSLCNSLQVLMLNSTQRKIIVGVSRACLDDPKAPKIGKKLPFLKKNVFFSTFFIQFI